MSSSTIEFAYAQGRNGHQQQRLGRDGRPRLVPRLAAKGATQQGHRRPLLSFPHVHSEFIL